MTLSPTQEKPHRNPLTAAGHAAQWAIRPATSRINSRTVDRHHAVISGRWQIFGFGAALLALLYWAMRHTISLMRIGHTDGPHAQYEIVFAVCFVSVVWQFLCYSREQPVTKMNDHQRRLLGLFRVTVLVPMYNEDPVLLDRCLRSLIDQTRKPERIYVVDDGSKATVPGTDTPIDYGPLRDQFLAACKAAHINGRWDRTTNAGKRAAQAHAVMATPDADVYVTVDSDSVLDREAMNEVLKPLTRHDVLSVAGLVVAINADKNFLTRFTDLWFVTGQLVDRSSMSALGSVLVNSGALAAYRATVLRDNLGAYLTETFRGKAVEFSDDSMLTIFALAKGKAVQQPTAIAFTAMPENFSHHVRQYTRWMRGAFIRSFWRFKYLPLKGYAYWAHAVAWVMTLLAWTISVSLFIIQPIEHHRFVWTLLLIPILVGYGQGLRYLTVRRNDRTMASQLVTYAITPVAYMWGYFGLRIMRWYAIATCTRGGWGTRDQVEVSIPSDGHELTAVA